MRFLTVLLLLITLSAPVNALAQRTTDPFKEGQIQFQAGNFKAAYYLLLQAFLADPTNLDISFLLGRAAYEAGDYESALMAYERILIMNPDANRVKLELARTNLKLGSREMAKQYFKEVLATNPPQQVMFNINRILAAIAAGEKNHFFNGVLSTNYNWDDNAVGTPSGDILYLYGSIPVALTDEEIKDRYFGEQAVFNHIYRVQDSPYSWKTSATLAGNFYEQQHGQNVELVALSTGPVRQTEKFMWATNISFANIDSGHDRYMGSAGIASTVSTHWGGNTILNFSIAAQNRNYYLDDDKDSVNLNFAGGLIIANNQNQLTFNVANEIETADADYNSYNRFLLGTRFDHNLIYGFAIFSGIQYKSTDYEEALAIFNIKRKDDQLDATLGISKLLVKAKNNRYSIAGQLSYTYTNCASNIPVYAYKKGVTSASITIAF